MLAAATAVVWLTAACGGDDETSGGGGTAGGGTSSNEDPDVVAGDTVVVAILNPTVNDAHNTGVPDSLGDERDGVTVTATPGTSDVTADGIAVVDVDPGAIDLDVGGAALSLDVEDSGDVYDAPIALDGNDAAYFDQTPIRYPVGQESGALFFDPDADFGEIQNRLNEDDTVVVLRPGTYKGTLAIDGEGILLFGEGWTDRAVIIDGSVSANGGNVRLRGLTITGDLAAKGNNFGISFSVVEGATSITGNAGAYARNVFCGDATVPSSNATLLDNFGIAPATELPDGICP
jgi:hypothetical protein